MSGGNRRIEFARSWPIVLVSFIGTACSVSALLFYTPGLFIKPLQAEFGWSRTALSFSSLIGAGGLALMSPMIGRLIDRHGGRVVAGFSTLALAVGFYAMSFLPDSLLVYYGLTLAITLLAAGSSPVVYSRAINQGFDRARGMALGFALTGTGVAGVLIPRFLPAYIDEHGWRNAYIALAFVIILAIPLIVLLLREKSVKTSLASSPSLQTIGVTRKQAFHDRRFWLMGAAFFLVALGISGIVIHFVPMLTDAGLSPSQAGSYAALIGVAVILGRCTSGLLMDRFFAPYVAASLFLLTMLGCVAIPVGGVALAPVAAGFIGFAIGGEVDMIGYMVARYFGMQAYGSIYGWQYAAFLTGNAISPLIAGAIYDRFGSYSIALVGGAFCLLVAAILCLILGPFPNIQDDPAEHASNAKVFNKKALLQQ